MAVTANVWRSVTEHYVHMNPGHEKHWAVGGSVYLILECGHKERRKLSAVIPKKANCWNCMQLKSGGMTYHEHDLDGTLIKVSWDAINGMPKRTRLPNAELTRGVEP